MNNSIKYSSTTKVLNKILYNFKIRKALDFLKEYNKKIEEKRLQPKKIYSIYKKKIERVYSVYIINSRRTNIIPGENRRQNSQKNKFKKNILGVF